MRVERWYMENYFGFGLAWGWNMSRRGKRKKGTAETIHTDWHRSGFVFNIYIPLNHFRFTWPVNNSEIMEEELEGRIQEAGL